MNKELTYDKEKLKIIQEKSSKINELKDKLPNAIAIYSLRIILAISLIFLSLIIVSYVFTFFGMTTRAEAGGKLTFAGAALFFPSYYLLNKNLPVLKKYYLLNKEIKQLKKDIDTLAGFEPFEFP